MSAESIKENAIRKVIQELIVPDLGKIMNKQDILEERINSIDKKLDYKIDSLKNEMDVKFDAVNGKIDSINDKIDLMNKYNERLLDIIHPVHK